MIAEHEGLKAVEFVCSADWCDKPGAGWSYTEWNPRHKRPLLVCESFHQTPGRRPRKSAAPPETS